jgi:hypothetical protein
MTIKRGGRVRDETGLLRRCREERTTPRARAEAAKKALRGIPASEIEAAEHLRHESATGQI